MNLRARPAIARDAHGVIFVFDPERERDARELEVFYSEFVQKRGMADTQCVVFAHFKDSGGGGRKGVKLCKLHPVWFIRDTFIRDSY